MQTDAPSSPGSESAPSPGSEPLGAALGRIPSGLFIVTWRDADTDRTMLVSWAMQAGFEPPLVSVAIGTTRDLLARVRAGGIFVVNVLSDSQRGLLSRFGKPPAEGDDPFAGLPVERTPGGVIALAEAAAWLECEPVTESLAVGADHAVVMGRVTATGGTTSQAPLIHLRRNGLRY
jgi:flavin reductase (DIM6/NTAB) family NADH-FMN oxidoreductase RutF